jgi:uroporphyrinogen III methyltransferase/synthase
MSSNPLGTVYLVGSGPGDLNLVTLRAKELVEQADAIVYDYLANERMLDWAERGTKIIYVGKKGDQHTIPQEEINQLLVDLAKKYKRIVRLKGGDPYLFGRGGEEAEFLVLNKVPYEVLPGVTSAIAAAAYAGIPITHRSATSTLTFVTGHEDPTKDESSINCKALAELKGTLAIYMGMKNLPLIQQQLMTHGLSATTPAAVIQWGTTSQQRSVISNLKDISTAVTKAGLSSPAIIIIGEVARYSENLSWFEKRPLLGQRIILTRTREQSSRLRFLLMDQGADVWELPTIHIKENKASRNWTEHLSDYNWLIFTSPNAVNHFFEFYTEHHDIRSLQGIKIAAVGPATAKAIEKLYLKVDLIPKTYTAEGIIEVWTDKNAKVLFPCGNLAKDDIEKGLKSLGATVDRLEVYHTIPETEKTITAEKLSESGADWIIFSSSSAVENFCALKLNYPKDKVRYASLGNVTSTAMREHGFTVDLESKESTMESLVEGLIEKTKAVVL